MIMVFQGNVMTACAPTFSHDLVLEALAEGANTVSVKRYSYEDLMNIDDVFLMSDKMYEFVIRGIDGHPVWKQHCSIYIVLREFMRRTSPFRSKNERALCIDRCRPYTHAEMERAFSGICKSIAKSQ